MSDKISCIYELSIITRHLEILTNWTTALSMCSVLIHIPQDLVGQSLIGRFEDKNPDITSIHVVSVSVVIVVIVCCHLYVLIYCSQATCQFWSKLGRNIILVFLNILYDFHLIWKFNPGPIMLSDCLKKSSSLKQHMGWKCYREGMFLWPSKKFMFFFVNQKSKMLAITGYMVLTLDYVGKLKTFFLWNYNFDCTKTEHE
jgi:hypothetical protein